jgi:hypothetical protein
MREEKMRKFITTTNNKHSMEKAKANKNTLLLLI